jgi:hypothetical protein
MDNEENAVSRATAKMHKVIDALPGEVAQGVLDEVSGDTPFGMALRQDNGQALISYFGAMSLDDMGIAAERLQHAAKAYEGHLLHAPHLGSLLEVINATANLSEMDEAKFYQGLAATVAVVPGSDADGNPTAMHMLYEKSVTEDDLAYDVLTQARNELGNEGLPDNERKYWEDTVRRLVPELSQHEQITAEMIPDSQTKIDAHASVDGWNAALGKGVGQMLHKLGSKPEEVADENDHSFLTDPANGQPHRDMLAAHEAIQADADTTGDGFEEGGYNTSGGSL